MACALLQDAPMLVWDRVSAFLDDAEALRLPLVARYFYAQKELARILLQKSGFHLRLVHPSLRSHSLCQEAVLNFDGGLAQARRLWQSISSSLSSTDESLLQLMVAVWPDLIPEIVPPERRTAAFAMGLLELRAEFLLRPDVLEHFPDLAADRAFVLRAVRLDGANLRAASKELQGDREIVLAAIAAPGGWLALDKIAEELLLDGGFVRELASLLGDDMWMLASSLQLEHHLDLAQKAVKLSPFHALRDLPERLRHEASVWRAAVASCPSALQFVPRSVVTLGDVREAVLRTPRVIHVLGAPWITDRSLALLACSLDGFVLASHRFHCLWMDDADVVLRAVTNNGLALEYASARLRDDEAIVRASVQQCGMALAFASRALRGSERIVELAARSNHQALSFSIGCESIEARARKETWKAPDLPLAPRALPIHGWYEDMLGE